MKKQQFFILAFLYSILCVILVIYSYSQVDLNLTLSSNHIYLGFQQVLTQLGYFNRPLSTNIFLFILIGLFSLYFVALKKLQLMTRKQRWILIGVISGIVVFSYPAFSHDFFNYLFDPRIFVKYGDNPYVHKALDYPMDEWIRFMRWTHRTYPYGPLWIALTIPVYAVGSGIFTLTMALFKVLFFGIHIGNVFVLEKIATKLSVKNTNAVVLFYALNPLIVVESIVSPHLDSLMLLLLLVGIFLFIKKKKVGSIAAIIGSCAVKFVTGAVLPLFVFFKKIPIQKRIVYAAWIFLLVVSVPIMLREPYPWYFIPFIGLAAISKNRWLRMLGIALSVGTLFRYAPFLYYGDYAENTQRVQLLLTVIPLIGVGIYAGFRSRFNRFLHTTSSH